jgi:hypothetical protein
MEIRSSTLLQKMMQAILLLGNTLNQGTNRGAARGFRLESIIKLKSTKVSRSPSHKYGCPSDKTMMMVMRPFGLLGLRAPSSGVRDVFTSIA